MAVYRAPRPGVEAHARHQNMVARVIGLALIWVLVGIMALVADRNIPAQHAFWKPLSVIDPIGAATKAKAARAGADAAACRAILTQGGLEFAARPPLADCGLGPVVDGIALTGGMAPLTPAAPTMTCKEALAVSIWERNVVQPAAFDTLGQAVVGIRHYGTYACRNIYGRTDGPPSEHAAADALDVAAFILADGAEISIARDWKDPGPKGQFLRKVRDGGCRVFLTVLSPDYNAAHANHFHMDMGGWPLCA